MSKKEDYSNLEGASLNYFNKIAPFINDLERKPFRGSETRLWTEYSIAKRRVLKEDEKDFSLCFSRVINEIGNLNFDELKLLEQDLRDLFFMSPRVVSYKNCRYILEIIHLVGLNIGKKLNEQEESEIRFHTEFPFSFNTKGLNSSKNSIPLASRPADQLLDLLSTFTLSLDPNLDFSAYPLLSTYFFDDRDGYFFNEPISSSTNELCEEIVKRIFASYSFKSERNPNLKERFIEHFLGEDIDNHPRIMEREKLHGLMDIIKANAIFSVIDNEYKKTKYYIDKIIKDRRRDFTNLFS